MKKIHIGGVTVETPKKMRPRSDNDFYPTEKALITSYLLHNCPMAFVLDGSNKRVADFGAGDGRWGSIAKKMYPSIYLVGTDIRNLPKPDGFDEWHNNDAGDIYKWGNKNMGQSFNVILGNPPYNILEDWLDTCFSSIDTEDGMVTLLLSLNILSGQNRYKKYYNNGYPISKIVICNTRPSFSENGKTYPGREMFMAHWIFKNGQCLDSYEYANISGTAPISHLVYDRNMNGHVSE